MASSRTALYEELNRQLNDLNRQLDWTQITDPDDPRIALSRRMAELMAAMTEDEQDFLLDKWGL